MYLHTFPTLSILSIGPCEYHNKRVKALCEGAGYSALHESLILNEQQVLFAHLKCNVETELTVPGMSYCSKVVANIPPLQTLVDDHVMQYRQRYKLPCR